MQSIKTLEIGINITGLHAACWDVLSMIFAMRYESLLVLCLHALIGASTTMVYLDTDSNKATADNVLVTEGWKSMQGRQSI